MSGSSEENTHTYRDLTPNTYIPLSLGVKTCKSFKSMKLVTNPHTVPRSVMRMRTSAYDVVPHAALLTDLLQAIYIKSVGALT
jgi:hypothetical protein